MSSVASSALRKGLSGLARALQVEELAPACCDQLVAYAQLVATWNQRVDLTAAKTAGELVEVLFADALVLSDPELIPVNARLLDVGTDVGAPIVPLVLLRPDLHAQCVEPRRKRVAFLRTVVGQLDLMQRLVIVEGRIELDGASPSIAAGSPPEIACSRATFAPPQWLPLALKLAPRAVVLAAREGLPPAAEGSSLIAQRDYALPSSGARRVLGVYARG